MQWNRADSGGCQAGTVPGSGVQGAGVSAIRKTACNRLTGVASACSGKANRKSRLMTKHHRISRAWARRWGPLVGVVITTALSGSMLSAQRPAPSAADQAMHAQEVGRLLITDAMVIYGNAKPSFGPVDILV